VGTGCAAPGDNEILDPSVTDEVEVSFLNFTIYVDLSQLSYERF
jgi:hypothetical protein